MDNTTQPNRDIYTLEAMRNAPKGRICQVRNLSESKRIEFTCDSLDVAFMHEYFGHIASDYDSFFFEVIDGDYANVWGMFGTVPLNDKSLTKVF